MSKPDRPRLPKNVPDRPKNAPDPLHRPDERKEGGPDFGKADRQHEHHERIEEEGRNEADPPGR
jgi:hypothetical protein